MVRWRWRKSARTVRRRRQHDAAGRALAGAANERRVTAHRAEPRPDGWLQGGDLPLAQRHTVAQGGRRCAHVPAAIPGRGDSGAASVWAPFQATGATADGGRAAVAAGGGREVSSTGGGDGDLGA